MYRMFISALLSILLLLIGLVLILILLPPCGLSHFSYNKALCSKVSLSQILSLDDQIIKLEQDLYHLKQEILSDECVYNAFLKSQQIQETSNPTKLSDQEVNSFNERDLAKFSGCWDLDNSAKTFALETCIGLPNCPTMISQDARYCFANDGVGSVTTKFPLGDCSGAIKANFNEQNKEKVKLIFEELANLQCDPQVRFDNGKNLNNISIIKRIYECELTSASEIQCAVGNSLGNQVIYYLKRIPNGN